MNQRVKSIFISLMVEELEWLWSGKRFRHKRDNTRTMVFGPRFKNSIEL